MIKRICWGLVEISSRMLDPEEREAVRGDLAESGQAGSRALRDVLGLVARRRAALWTDGRPWLALVGLVVPLGMLLSIVSKGTADGSAVYIWMYANNLDWGIVRTAGFWYEFAHSIPIILLPYLMLACWSWTCGFVIGSASRRIVRFNSVLLCITLLFGVLFGAPRYFEYYWQHLRRAFPLPGLPAPNDPVFALAFYRVMLPLIVQALLVVIPSVSGMRHGVKAATLRRSLRLALWGLAFAAIVGMVIQDQFWLFPGQHLQASIQWASQTYLLQFVAYWPVGYLATSAIGRRLLHQNAIV
jgi:hypothetical protein